MPAVAITDHHNMFGAIRHYNYCKKAGVRPILGSEVNIAMPSGGIAHLVLLAASNEGYQNLIRIVSRGYTHPASDASPCVMFQEIADRPKGLVALTGCMGGTVPQQVLEQGESRARPALAELRDTFEPGHLFVELQDHGLPEQPVLNGILESAARDLGLPLVATNDVHFMSKDDGQAQLYLDCVRLGRTYAEALPGHHGSFEMYLKSPAEMATVFPNHPEALKNTLRIAEMCSGLEL